MLIHKQSWFCVLSITYITYKLTKVLTITIRFTLMGIQYENVRLIRMKLYHIVVYFMLVFTTTKNSKKQSNPPYLSQQQFSRIFYQCYSRQHINQIISDQRNDPQEIDQKEKSIVYLDSKKAQLFTSDEEMQFAEQLVHESPLAHSAPCGHRWT